MHDYLLARVSAQGLRIGGMDEVAARQRARAEMRDNNKSDWRRG
jgi:hypothetical protein